MKGLVVVICAPSQGGKDFVAAEIMNQLTLVDGFDKVSYAKSYKVRKRREEDPEHICCYENESEIPVAQEDRIEYTIYGTQKVVYDKNEIDQRLENGEIVFITTASPELAKKMKKQYGSQCLNVFIKRQQVDENTMIKEDLKRHGISPWDATEEQKEESRNRVEKRIQEYETMKPEYVDFIKDETYGADYIFVNWYTLIGGNWNHTLKEAAESEFAVLSDAIGQTYRFLNGKISDKPKWFKLSKQDREKIDPLSLKDEWMEYRRQRLEKE